MSIAGKEALAGLQLLVAVAKADGELTADERGVIAEALEGADLPDGITSRALIESSSDVDSLIAQIHAPGARDVAFAACLTMANSNRVCVPKQQAILDKIETAWAAPAEKRSLLGHGLAHARDTDRLAHLEPTADRVKRDAPVKTDVDAKRRAHTALNEELAVEYRTGVITLSDYERKIVELN
jgi:hypothetical protein